MELGSKKVLFPDTRNEGAPVGCERGDPLRLFRNDIIGVDEVEEIPTLNPVEKRNFPLLVDGIPTHMRNFVIRVGVQFHYLSMDKVQPSLVPKFFTPRKENLQTETDAQIRFS